MSKTAIVRNVELHYVAPDSQHTHRLVKKSMMYSYVQQMKPTKDQLVDLGVKMKKHDDGYYPR